MLLLPTWIYSCRSGGTISFALLPFKANVTIFTSISQTFRSWVVILKVMRLSIKLPVQGYVRECLGLSRMVDTRIVSNNIKSHFNECYLAIGKMTNAVAPTTHYSKLWSCYQTDLISDWPFFLKSLNVSIENFQQVRYANRGRLLLRTPCFVPFGPWTCTLCRY